MASNLRPSFSLLLPILIVLVLYARPSHAFGAGNIASLSKVEGQNWRHGDIEDTLLGLLMTATHGNKKFSKMDVKRVYFGNWLRDYSQAVDVGTVKMVSAEAIRLLLWILGFLSFGFGTKEFEVTTERLGCYRPEEHIDNPKDYADNMDARQYDRRLRGPVDERRELSIDERTGLKHYIASEDVGITTSAGMVRDLLRRCIHLGRQYHRSGNKAELYEAFRLLGTANHCMEDYSAHSNYTELALIEMGERDVFPHVGRRTQVHIRGVNGPRYPIVTGTFGGVDFLHSVMGEVTDKVTQSELQELEGSIAASEQQGQNKSALQDLLNNLPDGLFGGNDEAGKADELQANAAAAQMQNMHITPKEPEEFTQQAVELSKQIYPILEFHDEIMLGITETIENIPVLPELIENLQDQLNVFVFSLIAPFILPLIRQIKTELSTGSSEIIQSSKEKQLIVFHDDSSSDPTHSMLSKDHFSNQLNEPAGKVASQVLQWAVPQIVECWDDERVDAERTIQRIIQGVFHHPALREYGDDGANQCRLLMFNVVHQWWEDKSEREKDDLRDRLSRDGVENGRNHKEGVHDSGHGCCKPLGFPGQKTSSSSGAIGGNVLGQLAGALSPGSGRTPSGYGRQNDPFSSMGNQAGQAAGNAIGDALGGGALGGAIGGILGGVGGSLLGDAFQGQGAQKEGRQFSRENDDGSYTAGRAEYGHARESSGGQRYGQAEYSATQLPGGGRREEYSRYEQDTGRHTEGYGYSQRVESHPTREGGYERREETRYESGNQWRTEERVEGVHQSGEYYSHESKHHGRRDSDDDDDDDDDYEKKERKRREKEEREREKEREKEEKRRHKKHDDDDSDDDHRKRHSGGSHGRRQDTYGEEQSYGESRREEYSGYGESRREEYGESRREDFGESRHHGREEGRSYGGENYGRSREEEMPGGFGESRREYGEEAYQEPSYRRQEPAYEERGYGRSREEEMPGGFGEEEGEGYGRRNRGYGGGGYGDEY